MALLSLKTSYVALAQWVLCVIQQNLTSPQISPIIFLSVQKTPIIIIIIIMVVVFVIVVVGVFASCCDAEGCVCCSSWMLVAPDSPFFPLPVHRVTWFSPLVADYNRLLPSLLFSLPVPNRSSPQFPPSQTIS